MKNQKGYIEGLATGIITLLVIGFFISAMFIGAKFSNETVSGIVYNTTNDRLFSGATQFSIRAGENTPVTEENQSTYCLPANSPYKELINRAAADKRVKVTVTESKYFAIKAPWTCYPNVKVTEIK